MQFKELEIKGVYLIEPRKMEDHRGFFIKYYSEDLFAAQGLDVSWKQANQSFTKNKGAFRGIHLQLPPFEEYKLIRCLTGSVMDIGVDLRAGSDTFLKYVSVELSAENNFMLLLPPGVGHAFQALSDNTTLIYLHSALYNPQFDIGVSYSEPKINLSLPLPIRDLSERDQNFKKLRDDFQGFVI